MMLLLLFQCVEFLYWAIVRLREGSFQFFLPIQFLESHAFYFYIFVIILLRGYRNY
ncbi:unnamed protein product [Meloidogyne enterolobii]|uniref:Uncharacterized protein n=1 Tax=Meloidogyne enterolobii TaxID=390850 RepID=A0ACB0ZFY7_MELEN